MRAQHWTQRFTLLALTSLIAIAALDRELLAAEPAGSKAEAIPLAAEPAQATSAESEASAAPPFTPYVDRTIPIPPLYFLFSLNLNATRSSPPHPRSTVGTSLGFGTGIVEGLTAEAAVGPLELLPDVRFRDLRFGLLYALIDTYPFELEPTVHVTLSPTGEHLLSQVEPGVIMALHAKNQVRFDTGAYLPITRLEKPTVGFNVPARAVVQVTRHVHAAMSTAISLPDLKDALHAMTIPLGFAAGYSAPLSGGVVITVTPSMSWPSFLLPSSPNPIHTTAFVVGLTTDLVVHP